MFHQMKLGRAGRRPAHAKLAHLAQFIDPATLPPLLPVWDGTLQAAPQMFDNDTIGDCVAAGLANSFNVKAACEGQQLVVDPAAVRAFYFALTGGQDTGLVEFTTLQYVGQKGFPLDGSLAIDGFAQIDGHSVELLKIGTSSFYSAFLGVQLPLAAQQGGGVWDVVDGPKGVPGSWGDHCLLLAGYDENQVKLITWGTVQLATWAWLAKYMDEAYVFLDKARESLPGVNLVGLRQSMQLLATAA